MTVSMHRTAKSALASYLKIPNAEVDRGRFEPSRTTLPIYFLDGTYWCSPSEHVKAPRDWGWEDLGLHEGRRIYRAIKSGPRFDQSSASG